MKEKILVLFIDLAFLALMYWIAGWYDNGSSRLETFGATIAALAYLEAKDASRRAR